MEQKVVFTAKSETINKELQDGWRVVSVTPQAVSCSGSGYSIVGIFCFVLEKSNEQ